MEARQVKTAADARRIIEARNVDRVKVGVFDVDGILRGKYMSKETLFAALEGGFGFCDVETPYSAREKAYRGLAFRRQLGIPDRLERLNVSADRADEIGRIAKRDPSSAGNPVPVNAAALSAIFRDAVSGRLA